MWDYGELVTFLVDKTVVISWNVCKSMEFIWIETHVIVWHRFIAFLDQDVIGIRELCYHYGKGPF